MRWLTARWDQAEAEVKKYRPDLLFAFQAIRVQVQSRKRRLTAKELRQLKQVNDTVEATGVNDTREATGETL